MDRETKVTCPIEHGVQEKSEADDDDMIVVVGCVVTVLCEKTQRKQVLNPGGQESRDG
jgi:hypothetical protein